MTWHYIEYFCALINLHVIFLRIIFFDYQKTIAKWKEATISFLLSLRPRHSHPKKFSSFSSNGLSFLFFPPLPKHRDRRGMKENLKLARFRFDQEFKQVNMDDFLKDFFNSPTVRSSLVPALSSFSPAVKDVKFTLLDSKVTSMDFFDPLQKFGITAANGYIKKCMEEYVNGTEVSDKLRFVVFWFPKRDFKQTKHRKTILIEDSEEFTTFTEKERNEFIFHLFSRLCIGGAVCQYEDYVTDYLNATKELYKDLVNVVKDPASGELLVTTLALHINSIDVTFFFLRALKTTNQK